MNLEPLGRQQARVPGQVLKEWSLCVLGVRGAVGISDGLSAISGEASPLRSHSNCSVEGYHQHQCAVTGRVK